jgi:hypothetical protein
MYSVFPSYAGDRQSAAMTGRRWKLRKRGRTRQRVEPTCAGDAGQDELPLGIKRAWPEWRKLKPCTFLNNGLPR